MDEGTVMHLLGVKQVESIGKYTTHNGVETGYSFMSVVIEASKA
jgi:hypothetical protein